MYSVNLAVRFTYKCNLIQKVIDDLPNAKQMKVF